MKYNFKKIISVVLFLIIQSCNSPVAPPEENVLLTGKIVFSSSISGESAIYTINPDGTDLKQLVTSSYSILDSPIWNPDGTQIAFLGRSSYTSRTAIYLMNADGSNVHLLPVVPGNLADGHFYDWSPDGSKIAYTHYSNSGEYNVIVSLTDGNVLNLKNDNDKIMDYNPKWSPDGEKIAFLSNRDYINGNNKRKDLYIMDANGKNVKRLTEIGGDFGYSWYPPDQSILLSVNFVLLPGKNDNKGLYKIDTTGNIRKLYELSGSGGQAISNNGKYLALSTGGYLTVLNLPVVTYYDIQPIFITNAPDQRFFPIAWSPDDKALLVISSDYGSNYHYLDMINIYTNKDNRTLKRLLKNDKIFGADWHK